MLILRMTSGPAAGQSLEIDRELVVGREGADLTIEDAELSRRHAALRPVEGGVEVEDLESLNGTFVNGERIVEPLTVTASATLKLGASEGALDISLPEVTRLTETPARPGPDVTAPRQMPDPDVTAQRQMPDPDVTARRPAKDPKLEATVARPAHLAGPPQAPDEAPPVRAPAAPSHEAEAPSGSRLPLIIGGALALVVVIVIVILLAG